MDLKDLRKVVYDDGDEQIDLYFAKESYASNSTLAIMAYCVEKTFAGEDYLECYANVTVNIGGLLPERCAFADTNNSPGLCRFLLEKGWALEVGEGHSGFCRYPMYQFSEEFLEEICNAAA